VKFFGSGVGKVGSLQRQFHRKKKSGQGVIQFALQISDDGQAGGGLFAFAAFESAAHLAHQTVPSGDGKVDLYQKGGTPIDLASGLLRRCSFQGDIDQSRP
jgi:hypothetical protein